MTMPRHSYFLALLLLLSPTVNSARETPELGSPAFTTVPELSAGFDLLYEQRFAEAREVFTSWESRNPDKPFGEVAIAASYLFEELDRQGVLTSDFFLDEKKFLHGIDGNPDSQRMGHFQEALAQARQLAQDRLHGNPQDDEGLLAQRPDAADAYIAPGIANYMVGSLNSGSRFALWFGGIHGDKRLGMAQVAKTAEQGRYLQPFAKIVLALAARRENQIRLAQRLLRELKDQYPDSVLFASEYAKATSARSGD